MAKNTPKETKPVSGTPEVPQKKKAAPEPSSTKKTSYFSDLFVPILVLLLGGAYFIKTSILEGPEVTSILPEVITRDRMGVLAVVVVLCLFALCEFPDTFNRRPSPIFWRFVLLSGVIYLCGLVFLSFHTVDEARQYMKFFDPKLGVPLPERSYASDCRIFTPEDPVSQYRNIRDAVVDEFFLGHAIGWYVKSMLFRDTWLSFFCSALFETMELSFRHILPNFYECWWDSIILDLIITNTLGIILGKFTLKLLGLKEYNWIGYKKGEPWYKWTVFSSPLRFIRFIFLLVMIETVELCVFTMKAHLWLPPPHPLVVGRLFIVAFVVAAALREYHEYVTVKNYNKWGPHSWVCMGIIFFEVLLSFKWYIGVDLPPFPKPVKYTWIGVGTVLFAFFFMYFPIRSFCVNSGNEAKEAKEAKKTTKAKKD